MKKISLNSIKSYLSRNEMRFVLGGQMALASCGALCTDAHGNNIAVLCMGSNCNALDYHGCSSDTEQHDCPDENTEPVLTP